MQTLELVEILKAEAAAFTAMAGLESKLQLALIDKKFLESEFIIHEMQLLSDKIVELDARRELEYEALRISAGLDNNHGFKDLLVRFDPAEREQVASAYRSLKVAVMCVKSATQGIDAYTRNHISVLKGMVDELYPERRQRTYTSQGAHRESVTPMVLDRTL